MIFLLKLWIFYCYVSLEKGNHLGCPFCHLDQFPHEVAQPDPFALWNFVAFSTLVWNVGCLLKVCVVFGLKQLNIYCIINSYMLHVSDYSSRYILFMYNHFFGAILRFAPWVDWRECDVRIAYNMHVRRCFGRRVGLWRWKAQPLLQIGLYKYILTKNQEIGWW